MFSIILEAPDFLIVEKSAGISTQPQNPPNPPLKKGGKGGFPPPRAPTLAHLVAERFPELKSIGGSDWGAVHRLDRETSGLVVFARNGETYEKLRSAFSKGEVEKEYEALVEGTVTKAGRIDWPIGPDPKSAKRVKVYKNLREARRWKGQEAVTIYSPLPSAGEGSGVRVVIKTGRRHQIRAHLAAIGHPIIGDKIYGRGSASGERRASRLYLHASRLRFRHPQENQWVEASSPSPFSSVSQSAR